ncbi:cupredoxin domain-containing protein [Jhaorihella thermophila]|uniref:Uncharacterized copper-binding protein, cupredoxin-like subfamily n=1 Tax=Jhaorihella thermophila TaxID=488547 RepID=A0A1H5UEE1_9RHOB|nr:plastocyanin/azurin family copper-binding protein [Jhaorihella thermophila]SEF73432.1 Uncharacterized copper-binding protein, cupredoxin-like subfamily [Jhaorihella thermophila]
MKKWTVRAAALAAIITLSQNPALAGGSHSGGHGHGDDHHAADIGRPGKAGDVDRVIKVKMGEMFFDPGTIEVTRGETIRFVITNAGEFVHEFNIGTAEMHKAHAGEMIEMMEKGILQADRIDHDRMMKSGMAHDDAGSVLLEPGQSAEIIWTFSGDADLELSCNLPGHRESGMRGTVKAHRGVGKS